MHNGWWSKGDGYNHSPGPDEMPTTRNRVSETTATHFICDDSATLRPFPRHSPKKLKRANLDGCNVFSNFLSHRHSFYLATGETPKSILRLTSTTRYLFLNETGRYYTMSPVNRAMMYMICWDPTHLIIILLLLSM